MFLTMDPSMPYDDALAALRQFAVTEGNDDAAALQYGLRFLAFCRSHNVVLVEHHWAEWERLQRINGLWREGWLTTEDVEFVSRFREATDFGGPVSQYMSMQCHGRNVRGGRCSNYEDAMWGEPAFDVFPLCRVHAYQRKDLVEVRRLDPRFSRLMGEVAPAPARRVLA